MKRSWFQLPVELGRMLTCLVGTFGLVVGLGLGLHLMGVEQAGRAARKLTVPFFVVLYTLILRLHLKHLPAATAFVPPPRAWMKVILKGFAAGAGSLSLVVALLVALGYREISLDHSILQTIGRALLSLLILMPLLAFLEEGLFRGLIFGRLERAGGIWSAIVLGALLFAATHFMRPPRSFPREGLDGVLSVVPGALAGLGEIPARWREFGGLVLVGLVLALIRWRCGSVYLGIGVHAGWVWIRKLDHDLTDDVISRVGDRSIWLGSNRVYDGFLGWCALLITLLVVLRFLNQGPRRPPEV